MGLVTEVVVVTVLGGWSGGHAKMMQNYQQHRVVGYEPPLE